MDFSALGAATSAISSAKELAKAAIGLRDFSQVAATVAEISDKLLKAQESLFALNVVLFELQGKYIEACEELRKAKEAIKQRERYSLVEIGTGTFAYQINRAVSSCELGDQSSTEPMHYVCQRCLDSGVKTVLQRTVSMGCVYFHCHACNTKLVTFEKAPKSPRLHRRLA